MVSKKRHRISTNFLSIKVFLTICIVVLFFTFFMGDNTLVYDSKSVLLFLFCAIIIGSIFLFILRKNVITFDYTDSLYVYDRKTKDEVEIPLEKIDKILFSVIGLNLIDLSNYSYRIFYRDNDNNVKKVRLFPRTFRKDISKIIELTKRKNPKVQICNWSVGWNELFD